MFAITQEYDLLPPSFFDGGLVVPAGSGNRPLVVLDHASIDSHEQCEDYVPWEGSLATQGDDVLSAIKKSLIDTSLLVVDTSSVLAHAPTGYAFVLYWAPKNNEGAVLAVTVLFESLSDIKAWTQAHSLTDFCFAAWGSDTLCPLCTRGWGDAHPAKLVVSKALALGLGLIWDIP